MESILDMHAIFDGVVQGVGFRMTAKYHAEALGLKGTVYNLPDGRVEVHAQGPKKDLDNLVHRLKTQAGSAKITSVDVHFQAPTRSYKDFRIVH